MVLTIKKQPYTGKFYAKKMQLYNTDSRISLAPYG